MKNLIAIILIGIIFSSCKSTELVYLSVLEPAPVSLPSNIKNVGVVNRSLISDQNKGIQVVDKIFSLESPNLDRDGAQASITALGDELMKNNRFTEIKLLSNTDLRTSVPGMFPTPLGWDIVEKICAENHTDALFALELFDTDSKINYTAKPTSISTPVGNVPAIEQQADMLTTVKTGWRIYDPVGRNILDEFAIARNITFSGRGTNPMMAASALIGRKEAVKQVGIKVGQAYAFRIIPYWLRVSRDYYVSGTDNFKMAKRKAQTGNWNEAGELWLKETTNPNKGLSGRACYNMAIISEINGDLDKAIQWAQKSYENYNNPLALRYVRILENRKSNSDVLKQQQPE